MPSLTTEGLDIRPIARDEYREFFTAVVRQFGEDVHDDDVEAYRDLVEYDRTLAAFDGDRIVGTAGAISFSMGLPGSAPVPCAGVTVVGVATTHRRRGVLTAMMRRQLDDIAERGMEPVAALYASESPIYGRYGYGAAAPSVGFEVERAWARFLHRVELAGRVRTVSPDEAAEVLPGIYQRAQHTQPGMMSRSPAGWRLALHHDPEHDRDGFSSRFTVVVDDRGYVVYRIDDNWERGVPNKTLKVEELVAGDDETIAALWQYCFSVDLVARVRAPLRPPDDPLPLLLDNRGRAWTTVDDPLYIRIVDVPTALGARRYGIDGALVLEVTDPFCPRNTGRWRLEADPDGAECVPTQEQAELSLDVRELGAVYLGGVRFRALGRAGLVAEHRADALRRADALFDADRAPWNPAIF